jgi:anti-sigma-K factor RskA
MRSVLTCLALFLLLGCSRDVRAVYPAAPGAPTGKLVLLLSQAASGVSVAVNGQLVVEDRKTGRVTIDNIPTGTTEITIAANGSDKQFKVWIDDTHTTTVPLGVPHESFGFLKSVFGTLISLVAYSLLN